MHSNRILLMAAGLIAAVGSVAYAGPAASASIVRLTSVSDAIVIGSAEASFNSGAVTAAIKVERVLKGPLVPGSSVSLVWAPAQNPDPSGRSWSLRGHGIFFLRGGSGGSWSVLSATAGDATWKDTYLHTPESLPRNLRKLAVANVRAAAAPLDNTLAEVVLAAEAGSPAAVDLVAAFHDSRSPVLGAAFRRFRGKTDPAIVSIGLRGLIAIGDPSAVGAVHQEYIALSVARGWAPLLQEIRSYYVNTTPEAIQALAGIVFDTNVGLDLKIAAAGALARMHTRQALPYLAKLLEAATVSLKAAGVGGLSSFANNVPIGSHEPAAGDWPYRTDGTIAHSAFDEALMASREAYYLGFWKTWWQQNRNSLER